MKTFISAEDLKKHKAKALDMLDMLYGRGKWNYPGNWCYGDGIFANSIKDEFKCESLAKLEAWAKS